MFTVLLDGFTRADHRGGTAPRCVDWVLAVRWTAIIVYHGRVGRRRRLVLELWPALTDNAQVTVIVPAAHPADGIRECVLCWCTR